MATTMTARKIKNQQHQHRKIFLLHSQKRSVSAHPTPKSFSSTLACHRQVPERTRRSKKPSSRNAKQQPSASSSFMNLSTFTLLKMKSPSTVLTVIIIILLFLLFRIIILTTTMINLKLNNQRHVVASQFLKKTKPLKKTQVRFPTSTQVLLQTRIFSVQVTIVINFFIKLPKIRLP